MFRDFKLAKQSKQLYHVSNLPTHDIRRPT